MNAARLRSLVERLLNDEREFNLQQRFQAVNEAIGNVVSQPGTPDAQTNFAAKLDELSQSLVSMLSRYQPAEQRRLEEIGALEFFSLRPLETIRQSASENPMTPAVVQKRISKIIQRRERYIQGLTSAVEVLDVLNIEADAPEEGEVEIGFLIPRDLFQNELDGLIKELRVIWRIIRAFAEMETGSVPPIMVRQISTSDPVFFFGLDPYTIGALAGAVTWALATWRQVEEIRKVRAETSKLPSFSEKEVDTFFGDKIRKEIKQAIDSETSRLVKPTRGKPGRPHEQRTDIEWALESLLARIERGMTVELRFLPPQPEEQVEGAEPTSQMQAFSTLEQIARELVFPAPDEAPVVRLPPPEPPAKKERSSNAG